MYLTLVFLPFIGFLFSMLFSRFLGSEGVVKLTLTLMFCTTLLSYIVLYEVGFMGSFCSIQVLEWMSSGLLHLQWGFYFDSVTVIMLIVVNTISFFVHLYSMEYMSSDPHLSRFMSYLSLFTFFMLILVTGDNFVQMFVGWEGVGLASYLLISFWYTRIQANKSAMKAMIVNRVGDFGLVLGIAGIFHVFKTFDFQVIFSLVPVMVDYKIIFFNTDVNAIDLITILLFVGAVGKSAQLGLHVWLPDAMEGPTPVSALIHAATMVTAGVFVLIRCSPLLEHSSVLPLITIFGALTAFFAATTGAFQNDLKKVIAYSTCSQLGYMVFSCGLSNYSVSLFHLMNHAFFKAMLFLGAGSIIHSMFDEQDMRRIGGALHGLRFGYLTLFVGSLALMGFPFLAGFYSKDVILELAYSKYTVYGTFAYWLGVFSAFLTAFYSVRLLYLVFYGDPTGLHKITYHVFLDSNWRTIRPLIILFLGSIFVGYLARDFMIGLGSSFWQNSLYIKSHNNTLVEAEFLPWEIKILPLVFSFSGALISYLFYEFMDEIYWFLYRNKYFYVIPYPFVSEKAKKYTYLMQSFYTFFNQKWFFDKIYYAFIIKPCMNFGYSVSFKLLDRGLIELLGPLGLIRSFHRLAKFLTEFQSGFIYHYALFVVLGLVVLLNYFIIGNLIVDNRIYILLIFLVLYLSIFKKKNKKNK